MAATTMLEDMSSLRPRRSTNRTDNTLPGALNAATTREVSYRQLRERASERESSTAFCVSMCTFVPVERGGGGGGF